VIGTRWVLQMLLAAVELCDKEDPKDTGVLLLQESLA
jgi:hypothetical protein